MAVGAPLSKESSRMGMKVLFGASSYAGCTSFPPPCGLTHLTQHRIVAYGCLLGREVLCLLPQSRGGPVPPAQGPGLVLACVGMRAAIKDSRKAGLSPLEAPPEQEACAPW